MRIESYISHSDLENERGDYYSAKDNLEKALLVAEQIKDKKTKALSIQK
ncbi:MAG: hypothetical protein R2783_00785 [Gelidibacter sp.]